MAAYKQHLSSQLPKLPRWWQFGGRIPANPDYSIALGWTPPTDDAPKGWPGSEGEWRVYKQLATPRLPVSYDRKPRPQLYGTPASFMLGSRIINVGQYNPLQRAALRGQGYSVKELTEQEAIKWSRSPK